MKLRTIDDADKIGAMSSSVSPAPEQRFSDRVENYVRYRPGYPEEIVDLLRCEAELSWASVIADIGSGTGISAGLFLKEGCTVFCVEPNRDMRAAAERLLGGQSGFRSIDGTASATTLPDHGVDVIVAAQAFHWFNTPDTRAEFSRILKPGGHVVLMWNERRIDSTPFLRDYERLLLEFGTDYAQVRHENIGEAELSAFFTGGYVTHSFSNEQRFDFSGLKGRLMSSSYAPAEGQPRHEAMLAELRRIFDAHQRDGEVCFEYDTRVHIGR